MFKSLILFKQKTIWQVKLNLVRQFYFKNLFKLLSVIFEKID